MGILWEFPPAHQSPNFDGPADARRKLNEMAPRVANYRHKLPDIGVGGDPDLAVQSLEVSPGDVAPGQVLTLTATVRNLGGNWAGLANLLYWRGLRGPLVGVARMPRWLDAGEVFSHSVAVNATVREGEHSYGACLSFGADNNRENDCADSAPVVVRGGLGSAPDLVPQAGMSSPIAAPGQLFTIVVTVRNQGGGPSTQGVLYVGIQEGVLLMLERESVIPGLAPAGNWTESFVVSAPRDEGMYTYLVCANLPYGSDADHLNDCAAPLEVLVRTSPCMVTAVGALTDTRRVDGAWAGACASVNRRGSHARHYSFNVSEPVDVRIELRSTTDSYLFLLSGERADGTILAENDNVDPGLGSDARIDARLGVGTYTVEATTYDASAGGAFTLTMERRSPFTDDPLVAGTHIKAVHVTELRSEVDRLRARAGLAPYGWVDEVVLPGVTRVKAVHLTDLRQAVDEVYDAEGRVRPRYSESVRPGGAILAEHLNELRRAVDAVR